MSGHARERAAWFGAALAAGALAMAPALSLPPVVLWPALAVTFGITPGVWLARRLAPGEASDGRSALALLLAAFASGVLLSLPRLAGVAATPAARGLAIALTLLAAFEALRPKGRHVAAPAEPWVWAGAVLAGLGVFGMHVLSPALAERSDGAFHAGVAWAALRHLPPEDPFFAGLALRYFWGPHAWAAGWLASAPALGAYVPFITSSAFALGSALLATGALARRLGAGRGASVIAQGLLLCGAAPFAWLMLAARAASGPVRGMAALSAALEHGADPALRALDPGTLHPSLVLPFDKFIVLTPFAWALAGTALAALALMTALEAPSWRAGLRLAFVVAAIVFLHPLAGVALALASLASLAAAASEARTRAAAGRGALGVVAALLVSLPYLFAVSGGEPAGATSALFGTDLRALGSVLWAGACLFPPAAFALWRLRTAGAAARALATMLALLMLPALVLRLGGDNQSKFLNLAFALAAAPAAVGWTAVAASPRRRVAVALLAFAAWAPALFAMGWAYAHQSDASADSPARPPAALLVAVSREVPGDAVLVDATQDTTRGAAPALVGATGRPILWSGGFLARKWGYASEPLQLRAHAASALGAGRWPEGATGEWLASLGREIWVLTPEDSARANDPRWHVVTRADGIVLARFDSPTAR